jgi:PKD repeat protein
MNQIFLTLNKISMLKRLLTMVGILCSVQLFAVTFNGYNGYMTMTMSQECAPVTASYSISPMAGTTSVYVYFGDGSTGTSLSGNHTYQYAGLYTVQVQFYDSFGYLGGDYFYLDLQGQPESIQGESNTFCVGDRVQLWMNVGNNYNGMSYFWDFGDGTTESSTYASVSHEYASTGSYTVTCQVTTPCGVFNLSYPLTVGTNVPMTSGNFWVDPREICPGDRVYIGFSGSSSQLFQYGDGTYDTEPYTHQYNQPGTYIITATLTNGCGNSMTLYDTVQVRTNLGFNPNSNLYAQNSSPVCPGEQVSFYTQGLFAQTLWQFPDGTTSTQQYVDNKVIPGFSDQTVYLTVTNGCGADTTISTLVQISSTLPVNDIDLMAPPTVCTGSNIVVNANGIDDPGNNLTYQWDMGDGTTSTDYSVDHTYAASGNYTITLTVTNSCGVDSTQTHNITVAPGLAPGPNDMFVFIAPEDEACAGDTVLCVVYPSLEGTYSFDMGDGTTLTSSNEIDVLGRTYTYVKHRYNNTGSYNITLTYTNNCGLSNTYSTTYSIGSNVEASANFFYDENAVVCLGEPLPFSAFGGNFYEWDFGDGTGTLITNETFVPVYHTYENPGIYTVTMKAINSCGNSETRSEDVVVPDNRIYVSTNTVDADCGEENGRAIAVITGGTAPYEVNWTSGDEGILVDSLRSGIYVVNVTDLNGCSSFGIATLNDAQAPAIVVNTVVDVSCAGSDNGAIDINIIGSTGPYNVAWSNGATGEDIAGLVAGPYEVIVTDANGCVATSSITVDEPEPVEVSFIVHPTTCGNNDGNVQALASGATGPYTFVWGGGTTGQYIYNVGLGIYTVNVIDQNGCVITESVAVSEQSNLGGPVPVIVSVGDLNCGGAGATIDMEIFLSSGNLSYNWNNGASTQDVTVTSEGLYSVIITDNANGCKAITMVDVQNAPPAGQGICMVTVDSMYSYNKVIWEKPVTTDIDYYNIYRESSQAGLYYLIGTVDYDSLSLYDDYVANPMITAWRYKIAAVDFCGEESEWSASHKTMHLTQNLGLAGAVNLIWDHYDGLSYSTYTIIRYSTAGGWENIGSVSAQNTSFTDPTPPNDPALFYVVEMNPTDGCLATRAISQNTARSNRTQNAVASPFMSVNSVMGSIEGITVFPNPNDGQFTLHADFVSQDDAIVEVYSMEGKVIMTINLNDQVGRYSGTIDLGNVPAGLYYVRVSNSTSSLVTRVVVQ